MKRKGIAFLMAFCCLLAVGCNQVVYEDTAEGLYAPPVQPQTNQSLSSNRVVTLYYPVEGEAYIAGIPTSVEIPSGETLCSALTRQLVQNAPGITDLSSVVWEGVRLVSTSIEGETAFVTLSAEFLNPPVSNEADRNRMMRNAIYCIVNTLTGTGEYASVQILVDKNNTRNGTRPKRAEVGFVGMGEESALEPLIERVDVVFTPRAAVTILLTAAYEQNWTRFKRMLASSENGVSRPDEEMLAQYAANSILSIVGFSVVETVIPSDGKTATASVDITVRYGEGDTEFTLYNKQLSLVLDNGVWKVAFSTIESILF